MTDLPIVSVITNPILGVVCDLGVCLLDATCELECPSKIMTTASSLVKSLLASAFCDYGLIICPAKNVADIEKCLAPGK